MVKQRTDGTTGFWSDHTIAETNVRGGDTRYWMNVTVPQRQPRLLRFRAIANVTKQWRRSRAKLWGLHLCMASVKRRAVDVNKARPWPARMPAFAPRRCLRRWRNTGCGWATTRWQCGESLQAIPLCRSRTVRISKVREEVIYPPYLNSRYKDNNIRGNSLRPALINTGP